MKLKEGMYVRLQEFDYTIIAKIVELDKEYDGFKADNDMYYINQNILKSSDNIIDLIEIGDYVNGYLVTGFDYQCSSNKKVVFSNVRLDSTGIFIPVKDIKSIVTKEQFNSVKYEVE